MPINTSTWSDFAGNLMQDFQSQYGSQSGILSYLTGILKPLIDSGGRGFAPSTLAAMRTSATDTTSAQFQNAEKALQQQQATNGNPNLPSGVAEQQKEQLAEAAATQGSRAQQDITLADEQQRQENLRFASNELLNVGHEYNPLGFAGAANQSGDVAANIENANTQENANSFGGSLMKGLGAGLGKLATGGLASVLSGDGLSDVSALYGGGKN